jgi:pimeloyl-ACP methyl ester carboxylesterase
VAGNLTVDIGAEPGDDDIEADRLFNYQLLPGFFGVDDYDALVGVLEAAVGPRQVLTFPYDWRLSNRHAAATLETVVGNALKTWMKESGAKDAKVWLVTHSMGGLVARYFCEELGGADKTRAIVTIGTPHRGSVNALDVLANGKRFGPLDLTTFVRNLASIYELLPLFPVLRTGTGPDMKLLRIAETLGLDPITGEEVKTAAGQPAAIDPGSVIRGLDRAKVQRAMEFHAAIRVPAEARAAGGTPSPYAQRVILNRRQHTHHSAALAAKELILFPTYPIWNGAAWVEVDQRGDGTVPARSSVPIEWTDTAEAIPNAQMHASMQSTGEAHDSLVNWLMPADTREFKGAAVDDDRVIVLDCPAVIVLGQELEVSVSVGTPTYATVEVLDMSTKKVRSEPASVDDTPQTIEFAGLSAGVHRVTVRSHNVAHPAVTHYVYVMDPATG